MPLSGRNDSEPLKKSLYYLLDNDLSPDIATALRLFEFNITHIKDIPELKDIPPEEGDSPIIKWCKDNNHVWITHDYSARKRHKTDLEFAPINVLWIRGHPEKTSNWQFFKIIRRIIDEMQRLLWSSHGVVHFKAGLRGGVTPEIKWAQYKRDKPRRESPQKGKHLRSHY